MHICMYMNMYKYLCIFFNSNIYAKFSEERAVILSVDLEGGKQGYYDLFLKFLYTRIHMHIYIYMYIHIYMCKHIHIFIYTYLFIYIYIYVYIVNMNLYADFRGRTLS